MPKTIKQRRREIKDDSALILRLQSQATELMLEAVGSPKWREFIANFIDNDNPEQLLRLTLQDDMANDPYIRQSLTYLLSTPMCGMDTPERLDDERIDVLDIGIASERLAQAQIERERLTNEENPEN